MIRRTSFRQLYSSHFPLVTPMAHDALSARLITEAGFSAVAIGGLAMLSSQHALPDLGIAGLGEMAEGARCVMRGTHLPCGIDGDDGYGDLKAVARTVEVFEELGLGSIIFEDQARASKLPGETAARNVIETGDMVAKLRAAVAARSDPDTIILARCDALASEGMDAALRRADRYLAAGADGILISGMQSVEGLSRAGNALRGAIQIAVITERTLGLWPEPKELYAMGYSQVVFPHLVLSHAVSGISAALRDINGIIQGAMSMAEANRVPGVIGSLQESLGQSRWFAFETVGPELEGKRA